jgi:hypothetical protein
MEPRKRESKPRPEPPQVEGGEMDAETAETPAEPAGGMIDEGGRSGGGAADENHRDGGMLGQG